MAISRGRHENNSFVLLSSNARQWSSNVHGEKRRVRNTILIRNKRSMGRRSLKAHRQHHPVLISLTNMSIELLLFAHSIEFHNSI